MSPSELTIYAEAAAERQKAESDCQQNLAVYTAVLVSNFVVRQLFGKRINPKQYLSNARSQSRQEQMSDEDSYANFKAWADVHNKNLA